MSQLLEFHNVSESPREKDTIIRISMQSDWVVGFSEIIDPEGLARAVVNLKDGKFFVTETYDKLTTMLGDAKVHGFRSNKRD